MNKSVPTRAMRANPDIDQLKRHARELLEGFLAGVPAATAEVRTYYSNPDPSKFALHDAQLVLARSYGLQSWPKLKAYVDGVTAETFKNAIRKNNLERVRDMLRLRPELANLKLSAIDERALHHAVIERLPEIVRLLVEHGADPNAGMHLAAVSGNYPSALDLAAERGYTEIVALLQGKGKSRPQQKLDPRQMDPALTQAFQRRDESALIGFLKSHADLIQLRIQDGMTALHLVSAFLLQKVAIWLLDHQADVNAVDKDNHTPLDVVGGRGWAKNGPLEPTEIKMMELLLARGAKRTPRWAIATGDAAWLQARHAEGTLGNPTYAHEGLLSLAVRYERSDILSLLLDLGFDPDERKRLELEPAEDSWGQPLRNCALRGKLDMAEILLARGADPNAHIYASDTPLFVAYDAKNTAMIELLERHGGYLDAEFVGGLGLKDRAEQILADEAAGRLRPDALPSHAQGTPVAEQLIKSMAMLPLVLPRIDRSRDDPWWAGPLREAWAFWDTASLKLLLERCNVQVCAPTMLHDLAGPWPRSVPYNPEDRVAKAILFLDAGARLNVRDDWFKSTPLGWACRFGRIELAKLFLERGADPRESDAEPWATPAAWAETMNRAEILSLLQRYGG